MMLGCTSSEHLIQFHPLVLLATPVWEQKAHDNVKITSHSVLGEEWGPHCLGVMTAGKNVPFGYDTALPLSLGHCYPIASEPHTILLLFIQKYSPYTHPMLATRRGMGIMGEQN